MATRKHTYTHTYTRDSQYNHASVGLAQARPNHSTEQNFMATLKIKSLCNCNISHVFIIT